MSEHFPQEFIVHNQAELEDLAWEIEASAGQFSLIIARCNYIKLRVQLIKHLQQLCPLEIRVLVLESNETALYTRIQAELIDNYPGALMVFGLETVSALEQLLSTANQVREEFRKNCPLPIVLWVTDYAQRFLVNDAPDLESWTTKTYFSLPPEALNQGLQQASDYLFSALLQPQTYEHFDAVHLNLDLGLFAPSEVTSAIQELQNQGQTLSLTLQADLNFVRGLRAENPVESLQYFERSLQFWQQSQSTEPFLPSHEQLLRQGLVLLHLGQIQYKIAGSNSQTSKWTLVERSLQLAITKFEQANRIDLVTLCIPLLERIFQKQQAWDELEAVATRGLELHRVHGTQTRLSQDYGFLAKVALERQQWATAKQAAEEALAELAKEKGDRLWLQSLYLLFLAQAERQLGKPEAAIAHLMEANAGAMSDHGYPKFAIQILETLRDLYFERHQYLEAFYAKQERRSIEQQYGLRAFVGAGRLQPRRQEAIIEFQSPTEGTVAPEIAAAGRQQDLTRLIERIGRRDYRLIVIHGNSGVGKSSLLSAGLVPTLKQKAIDVRDNIPVVMRTYTQWIQELDRLLDEDPRSKRFGRESLLTRLKRLDQKNLRTVLIFDQFEEFFFVYQQPEERKPFFDFLAQCLQILSLNIVFSLREDYLHFLLEFNRLPAMMQTGIDVLSRNVLYELGNFSVADAKTIIQNLTQRANFYVEPTLTDQLVEDLSQELGTVRPIELQVVGAQLQEENITTLTQYQACGQEPKQELVKRYLNQVVVDCGPENRQLAELVLFLLTDEKGARPLKTRAELEKELQVITDTLDKTDNSLDLVLPIFVESGLVFLLPEFPADRYQLVHDYIATLIRQQQETKLSELMVELEQERGQRRQVEAQREQTQEQLNRVLNRRLQEAYIVGAVLAVLTVLAISFWWSAETQRRRIASVEIEALNAASQARLASNNQLEALVAAVQAAQRAKQANISTDLKNKTVDTLRQAFQNIQESNRFEGHKDSVYSVTYAPNGQFVASAGADNTIRLWNQDGTLLKTLSHHEAAIWIVAFSPDGKILVSAGEDGKIQLWNSKGNLLKTLKGTKSFVTSVSFNPKGKEFASAGQDGKIRLWDCEGNLLKTFVAHDTKINSLSFSPDGKLLASASDDKTARLWRRDGTLVKTLSGHSDVVWSISFSPDGKTLASASWDKTVKLWDPNGHLLRTLEGHTDSVLGVSFSPDSQLLASASADKSVRVWQQQDGQLLTTFQGHTQGVRGVAFSPDGKTIVSAGLDTTIRLWQYSVSVKLLQGHQGPLRSVAFSSDGQLIASSSLDETVRIWKVDGTPLRTLTGPLDRIVSLSFSPDGQLLAGGSRNSEVWLWELSTNTVRILTGHQNRISSVQFSPDGQFLASSSQDGTVRIWERDGSLSQIVQAHSEPVNSISFSPNGRLLASASDDGTIKLWNRSGSLLKMIPVSEQEVSDVVFSPDGQLLASAGYDGIVKLWNQNGELLEEFTKHKGVVWGLSFSPDSQIIASGDSDGIIYLWNREGNPLQMIEDTSVWDLRFSPTGYLLASASDDINVKLWEVDRSKLQTLSSASLDNLIEKSCTWLGDYLKNNSKAQRLHPNPCIRFK